MTTPWYREFDLAYWQMREALGFPIPDRIDQRFRGKLAGNGGGNPFSCGKCSARMKYPGVNVAHDILWFWDHLSGAELEDFHHRIRLALHEAGIQKAGE